MGSPGYDTYTTLKNRIISKIQQGLMRSTRTYRDFKDHRLHEVLEQLQQRAENMNNINHFLFCSSQVFQQWIPPWQSLVRRLPKAQVYFIRLHVFMSFGQVQSLLLAIFLSPSAPRVAYKLHLLDTIINLHILSEVCTQVSFHSASTPRVISSLHIFSL